MRARLSSPASVTALLAALAVGLVCLFAFGDLSGAVDYILPRRLQKVASMSVVAVAVALSTLIFQTVTANRLLTPSIMGLDALYILLQTGLVAALGAHTWVSADARARFAVETALLLGFSVLLYSRVLTGRSRSLHLLLLVGLVLGTLFRGISGLIQRLIDPNDYLVLQDLYFASFNQVSPELLGLGSAIIAVCAAVVWRMRRVLDVLALGRESAVSLGVPYPRAVAALLLLSAVLVAVSTALVGPVTFFGLLVVSVAYQLCRRPQHAWLMPMASLVGVVALVGGQLLLERLLSFTTPLAVILELIGGLVFLVLVLKGSVK